WITGRRDTPRASGGAIVMREIGLSIIIPKGVRGKIEKKRMGRLEQQTRNLGLKMWLGLRIGRIILVLLHRKLLVVKSLKLLSDCRSWHINRPRALGREIDEHGNVISVTKPINHSTLMVNKQKKDAFQKILKLQWWDAKILTDDTINELSCGPNILIIDTITENHLNMKVFNCHIEHPFPIEPPAEAESPPPQPLKMTKEEHKRLRTQRRVAKEMEKREMIRQKSKVKMSNLMKVGASDATQNPTKLEKEIRTEAAEREQAQMDRNVARKLTPAEKREKKERKLFGDPTTLVETIVSVYKINKKLSDPKIRFKVERNAKQNKLTGCSVMMDEMSVVVVEGKSKAIKRYEKLMLKRINWEKKEDEEEENGGNKCCLVWQGTVEKPGFHRFRVKECLTNSDAKKVFTDAGAHYWDLALNYSDD
ncbi:unnamed protein product, partial [Arabidopsis halleri]